MNNVQKVFFDSLANADCGQVRTGKTFSEKRFNDLFLNFATKDIVKGGEILEICCGKGSWTIFFLKAGYKVTAVDISQKSLDVLLELAKKNNLEKKLTIIKADAQDYVLKNKFDMSFCFNLLHHVNNPNLVVRNMYKSLKVGGVLVAHEPNPLNLWWWIGAPLFCKHFSVLHELGIAHCSPWALQRFFANAGLTKIEVLPQELFPLISPDRFKGIINIQNFLFKIPYISKFAALNIIRGVKK